MELALLVLILAAQAVVFSRLLHAGTNYDEGVYLAALDALRHGQRLGSDVFAAQFPGFYELLRGLSYLTGIGVAAVRAGLLAVTLLGTVGGYLVGRRFGSAVGGLLVAAFLTIAPPLDLFGAQVIADTPALALTVLSLGIATFGGPAAAVLAGAVFGGALSIKLTALTALPVLAVLVTRRRLAPALAGFGAVVAALVVAHVHAVSALWSSGVTYHDKARSTPAVMAHPHRQILEQIPHSTPFFVLALLSLVLAVACAAVRRPLHVWPLWSWVALSVVFLLLHAPLHDNHLIVFPFTLAVAAGSTIGAGVHRLSTGPARAAALVLLLAVGAGLVQQLHRVDVARTPEPATNLAAVRALERLTTPDARTIDDRPIISFLAHRRVVGPLVDLAKLRFETGSLDDRKVIRELPRADAVVVSRALRDHPAVLDAVRKQLRLRYDRGGVQIYVR